MPTLTTRVSGPAAIVGGLLWVAVVLLHAARPVGCVGAGCAVSRMRSPGPWEAPLLVAAALLLGVAAAALVTAARATGRWGRLGRRGVLAAAAGFVVLALGGGLQSLVYGGDWSAMPLFVGPGILLASVRLVLVGVAVLRARVISSWAGVALVAGGAAMLASNEQTALVLFFLPFGVGWVMVGIAMLTARGAAEPSREPAKGHEHAKGPSMRKARARERP
ncbi:hypothetical protein [Cellulomonas fimi]|uniref:Integral membrane protein n=1 Tax=Cellulomonas fimi TaxID=1708 RepID=A0A7Y0LUZ7_CELFI|nr:hypothetical protein [Cellulomonas fimi]NMR18702.1 hypothetical protein [Cellulomonas fimi]